jgi:hypothetical protein
MNDHHASNVITGAGVASATVGSLFAQAGPGAVGVAGSVLALALLLVRAAHEVALRWIDWQAKKIEVNGLKERIHELETEQANNRKLASHGYCPLDPGGAGQPACLRTAEPGQSSGSLPPVPRV